MRPSDTAHWTIETYAAHNEALRAAEEKFQNERDRRLAEVKQAEEKAAQIKDRSDRDALGLAREIQTYKDEKANELREQINSERGSYATKDDLSALSKELIAMIKPLAEYAASGSGKSEGIHTSWIVLLGAITLISTVLAIGTLIYSWTRPPNTPQVIYTTPAPR